MEAHLATSIPDLITLDVTLPDGDGVEVCRRLRENHRLDVTPIIIISSIGKHETMVQCLRTGAEEMAYTDGLTGLLNRRFMDRALKKEIGRAKHERRPFSLLLIDLDLFLRPRYRRRGAQRHRPHRRRLHPHDL